MSEGVLIALIMAGLGTIGSIVNGYLHYRSNKAKKMGNNPHPCGRHEDEIKEIRKDVKELIEDVNWIKGVLNGKR